MRAGIKKYKNAPNAYAVSFLPSRARWESVISVFHFYRIRMAKSTAKRLAPIAMLFLPAEPLKTCVGVLVALVVPFEVVVTAKVE
jgi:hypothetical protein